MTAEEYADAEALVKELRSHAGQKMIVFGGTAANPEAPMLNSAADLIERLLARTWRDTGIPTHTYVQNLEAAFEEAKAELAERGQAEKLPAPDWRCSNCNYPWPVGEGNPNMGKYDRCSICGNDEWDEVVPDGE